MLYRDERSSTVSVILKELRNAVQARSEGAGYDDAEGFAWRRAEWRVRYGLVDPSHKDRALQILSATVKLGMSIFADIAGQRDKAAALANMVQAQTGITVWF